MAILRVRLRCTFIILSSVKGVSEAGAWRNCAGGNVNGNDGNHIRGQGGSQEIKGAARASSLTVLPGTARPHRCPVNKRKNIGQESCRPVLASGSARISGRVQRFADAP